MSGDDVSHHHGLLWRCRAVSAYGSHPHLVYRQGAGAAPLLEKGAACTKRERAGKPGFFCGSAKIRLSGVPDWNFADVLFERSSRIKLEMLSRCSLEEIGQQQAKSAPAADGDAVNLRDWDDLSASAVVRATIDEVDTRIDDSKLEEDLEKPSGELQETSSAPAGSSRPVGYFTPNEKSDPNSRFDVNGVGEQDGDRIALTQTDDPEAETGGSVVFDQNYGGAGYEECGKDIDRLLSSVAEDRVNTRMEQELSEELQAEANHIHYGNAHLGIHVTVNRMSVVPEYLAQEYSRVSAPLLLLSKRMQKQVLQALKDRRQGGKQNGHGPASSSVISAKGCISP